MPGSSIELAAEPHFELGHWTVRPSANEVEHAGRTEQLEPRVMMVLVALGRRAGETVSREQLIAECWSGAAVTDDALTRCISRLRKLFNSSPGAPTIETISKVGYRLLLPRQEASSSTGLQRWRVGAAVLTAVALLAVVAVVVSSSRSRVSASLPVTTPVTALYGVEQWPAITPAGGLVAYSWDGGSGGDWDLYVQPVDSEDRLRLTDSPGIESHAAWSPDGGRIAFARRQDGRCEVFLVAAVGGAESPIADCGAGLLSLDWSPTGDLLAYSSRDHDLAPGRLSLFDLELGSTRDLPWPIDPSASVDDVAFSPSGEELAYTLAFTLGAEDLFVRDLAGGEPRRVTFDNLKIHGFDWLPDSSGFVISSNRGGEFALWHVPLGGGVPAPVPGAVGGADTPRVSLHGQVVYEAWRSDADLYRLTLGGDGEVQPIVATTRYEWDAERSPDGHQLVFVSDRSGTAEIWVADGHGARAQKITSFGGPFVHAPRWSPDARQIAFCAPVDGNLDLFLVTPGRTSVERLTHHEQQDFAPSWAPSGDALYFGSTRSGDWQIWRLDLESRELRQMTREGGRAAQVSIDGESLYYIKADRPGLWSLDLFELDARESLVIADLEPVDWNNWQQLDRAIYYARRPRPDEPELVRYDTTTGEVTVVARDTGLLYKSGLWVAPDESEVLFTQVGTRQADLMLVELGS